MARNELHKGTRMKYFISFQYNDLDSKLYGFANIRVALENSIATEKGIREANQRAQDYLRQDMGTPRSSIVILFFHEMED